ncbi:hypothetical protein J7L36_00540 [bacterium]|nr:hypothetical protein [bacterium]
MLGDGSVTSKQIQINLNKVTEKEYQKFVNRLIETLFGIKPSTLYKKECNGIRTVVSSIELSDFLSKIGLKRGKGKKVIPGWIFKKKKYQLACLRGLIDTDGCVFTHRYKVSGKIYSYKKLAFKNSSYSLIESVYRIFKNLDFHHPRITKNCKEVRIENKKDVQKYFQLIGFHNSKNLKRYLE